MSSPSTIRTGRLAAGLLAGGLALAGCSFTSNNVTCSTSSCSVTLTGVGLPGDTGADEWSGANPLSVSDTETVTEVVYDSTFEGQTVAFVGTTAEVPFRVYLLEGPTRVVLEVADEA